MTRLNKLPAHEILELIASANSQGSDEPAHLRSLTFAARSIYKIWIEIETRPKLDL